MHIYNILPMIIVLILVVSANEIDFVCRNIINEPNTKSFDVYGSLNIIYMLNNNSIYFSITDVLNVSNSKIYKDNHILIEGIIHLTKQVDCSLEEKYENNQFFKWVYRKGTNNFIVDLNISNSPFEYMKLRFDFNVMTEQWLLKSFDDIRLLSVHTNLGDSEWGGWNVCMPTVYGRGGGLTERINEIFWDRKIYRQLNDNLENDKKLFDLQRSYIEIFFHSSKDFFLFYMER